MKLATKRHIIKEVEFLVELMEGDESRLISQICVLIVVSTLSLNVGIPKSTAQVQDYSKEWRDDITVTGGRTLLVEELSATWCTSCAEIDPFLQQVADAHGSRISIVTYHPTDGEDAFQPAAAQQRIDRMRLINPDIGSTPTFVVESGALRIGPQSWPDVQKDILKEETNRQETSQLSFKISKQDNNYIAVVKDISLIDVPYQTQLTFILMTHGLPVPEEYFNPGEDHRDRVVIATSTCHINNNSISNIGFLDSAATSCSDDFSVNFSHSGKFSLVLIHEATDESIQQNNDPTTIGVVEFAYRDIEVINEANVMPLLFFSFIVIGVIWVLYGNNNSENSRKT